MRTMRTFPVVIILASCGSDPHVTIDAAPDSLTLDCSSYCAEVQANCMGANAQYTDMAHCMAACASFAVGTSTITDASGNTLGCRIYHAGAPAKMSPTTHCVHAGPGGDLITAAPPAFCSGGDICASFCALEIKACGSVEAPLPGNPRDETGNPLFQYVNMANCMTACGRFDKTHAYSPTATGDSLACRLNAAIGAAIAVMPNGTMSCPVTASAATGACAGAAMP